MPNFDKDFKDYFVSLGIILTFLVGVINLLQTRKKTRLENITQNRVEWISILRGYIADIITITDLVNVQNYINDTEKLEQFRNNLSNRNSLIKLHLNFKGSIDKRILCELNNITSLTHRFAYLTILAREIKNQHPVMQNKVFKNFVNNVPDRNIIEFLFKYSFDNNPNTALSQGDLKLEIICFKEKVINDYISLNKSYCFLDIFNKKIMDLINEASIEIDFSKKELIKLTQIYLKAEWTRIKKETQIWPFCIYNEDKIIKQLEMEYKLINKNED